MLPKGDSHANTDGKHFRVQSLQRPDTPIVQKRAEQIVLELVPERTELLNPVNSVVCILRTYEYSIWSAKMKEGSKALKECALANCKHTHTMHCDNWLD